MLEVLFFIKVYIFIRGGEGWLFLRVMFCLSAGAFSDRSRGEGTWEAAC